jgi:general secretion pathway protein M
MSTEISPWLSRALAVTLLAVLLWTIYAIAVAPVIATHLHYRQALRDQAALLQRYRRIAADLPRVERELAGLQDKRPAAAGFLPAASDTLAAADLQNQIKTFVETAGGALKSLQSLPVHEEGSVRRVAVRVQMSGGIEAMQQVLYAIETTVPLLFVDSLDIQGRAERQKGGSEDLITLDSRFDVSGFIRSVPK